MIWALNYVDHGIALHGDNYEINIIYTLEVLKIKPLDMGVKCQTVC